MPAKKTREETLLDFKDVHGDKYLYDRFLEYVNNSQKIEIFCKEHSYYFNQTIRSHKTGIGCPKCGVKKCAKANTKTLEQFVIDSTSTHGDKYKYTSTIYVNNREKVSIYCKIHNYHFKQYPKDHINGCGCPKCGDERMIIKNTKSKENFVKDSISKHGDKYLYDKVDYKNSFEEVIITCKKHGDFKQLPYNNLIGHGCKKCNSQTSKAEKEIAKFIKEYVDIIESDRSVLGNLELDILIPSLNTAIEFNGLYWHSDKYKHNNYHLDKTKNCLAKGIKLIHIFEDEWRDKKEIVKSRLLNIIGKTETKIFARQCEVRELESKTVSQFLDDNHIQGKVGGKVRLGLYYKEELVSLMTFGNLRKALGSKGTEQDFELLRFCNKLNTTVVGGASKLLKYFENNFDYKTIISYADRRWSEGNLYFNLGFELVSETKPNYFYTKGEFRENRFKYRKSELKAHNKENRTEKQLMEELGYSRIYDSGTLKFKKEKPNV